METRITEWNRKERELNDKIRTGENDIRGMKSELKQAVEARQTIEDERDHFKSEMEERARERDDFRRTVQELEDKNAVMKRAVADLEKLKAQLGSALKSLKEASEETTNQLSCLSCLEFLKDPLMLICGHSICQNCLKTHSDPNSKDSIVFCEECKIETKNKDLHGSRVIEVLVEGHTVVRRELAEIETALQEVKD